MDLRYYKLKKLNQIKIAELEAQLTGDTFADMNFKDRIHKLKLKEVWGSCDIHDLNCEAYGSYINYLG